MIEQKHSHFGICIFYDFIFRSKGITSLRKPIRSFNITVTLLTINIVQHYRLSFLQYGIINKRGAAKTWNPPNNRTG